MKKKNITGHLFMTAVSSFLTFMSVACGESYIDEPPTDFKVPDSGFEMDTVSSHFVYEYEYQPDVVELSENILADIDPGHPVYPIDNALYFKGSTDRLQLPAVGTVVVVNANLEKKRMGFSGRVTGITEKDGMVVVNTEQVELTEIYYNLKLDSRTNTEQLASFDFVIPPQPMRATLFDESGNTLLRSKTDGDNSEASGEEDEKSLFNVAPYITLGPGCQAKIGCKTDLGLFEDPTKTFSASVKLDIGLKIAPLFDEKYIVIRNGVQQDFKSIRGADISMSAELHMVLDFKVKKALLQLNTLSPVPVSIIGTPICTFWHDNFKIGFEGSLESGVKTSFKNRIQFGGEGAGGGGGGSWDLKNDKCKSDASINKSFNFEFDKLKTSGTISATNFLGVTFSPTGPTPILGAEQKLSIGTEVDLGDENEYADNPPVKISLDRAFKIFMCKNLYQDCSKKVKGSIDVNLKLEPLSGEMCKVFKPVENVSASRSSGSTEASINFRSSPFYLLSAMKSRFDMLVVDDRWFSNDVKEKKSSILKTIPEAEMTYNRISMFDERYRVKITGLDPDKDYYAVPVFFLKANLISSPLFILSPLFDIGAFPYYGEAISFKNRIARLGIIGPSTGYDSGRKIQLTYTDDGRVETINDDMMEYDFTFNHTDGTFTVTDRDEHQNKTGTFRLDPNTGLLSMMKNIDDNEVVTTHFFYNDKMQITRIEDDDTNYIITWDNQGRLTKVEIPENHIAYYLSYDGLKNKCGQWTFCTASAIIPSLPFTHLLGKAPSELPYRMECVDSGESQFWFIDYEIRKDDDAIESENITVKDGVLSATINLPYGYMNIKVSDDVRNHDESLDFKRSPRRSASQESDNIFKRTFWHRR